MKIALRMLLFISLLIPVASSQASRPDVSALGLIFGACGVVIGVGAASAGAAIAVAKKYPKYRKPIVAGGALTLGSALALGLGFVPCDEIVATVALLFVVGAGGTTAAYGLLKKVNDKINDQKTVEKDGASKA